MPKKKKDQNDSANNPEKKEISWKELANDPRLDIDEKDMPYVESMLSEEFKRKRDAEAKPESEVIIPKNLFTAIPDPLSTPSISYDEIEDIDDCEEDYEEDEEVEKSEPNKNAVPDIKNTAIAHEFKNDRQQSENTETSPPLHNDTTLKQQKPDFTDYVAKGDDGKKYKYVDFPTLNAWYVDYANKNEAKWAPDTFYSWCRSYDVGENEEQRQLAEEKEKNFKSKYQHDNPEAPNYIDLSDKFFTESPLSDLVNVFARETRLDRAFHEINIRKRKERELDKELNGNGRKERILDEAQKIVERDKANRRKQYIKDRYGSKDRMTDKEAGMILNDRYHGEDEINVELDNEDPLKEEKNTTPIDWWDTGITTFKLRYKKSLEILYTGEGKFGGIEFMFKHQFAPMPGLNVPKGKAIFRSLKNVDRGIMGIIAAMPKDSRGFWQGCFSGDGYKSAISKFAYISDVEKIKSISIDGNDACKMIPPTEWFDKKIQSISPRELLGIFPAAEADTLLLHIGRTALGISKQRLKFDEPAISKILELPNLQYDYRTACVLHGSPGTGKSTLVENLMRSFYFAGYSTGTMSQTFNQFGWEVVANDFVVCDDLNETSSIKLLQSDRVKSAISGNIVSVERKGVDGREMQARASFIFSTNTVVFPKNNDPGVLNRMHFLQTYSADSLQVREKSGQRCFISTTWNHYAQSMNTSLTVLGLWLIRCGLNAFLEELEVYKITEEDGSVKWFDDAESRTQKYLPGYAQRMEDNRKNYVFQVPVQETDYLPEMARKALVFAKFITPDLEIQEEFDESFNAFSLMLIAETFRELDKFIKRERLACKATETEISKDILFAEKIVEWLIGGRKVIGNIIWYQFVANWYKKVSSNGSVRLGENKLEFEQLWDASIQLITTIDGRTLDKVRENYKDAFKRLKTDQEVFKFQLDEIAQEFNIDRKVKDRDAMRVFIGLRVNPVTFESVI